MARRNKRSAEEQDAALVTVSRRQCVRYQGRNVASVEEEDDGIIVWRKRSRGGKYDRHFFPWARVVTYSAGPGGNRSPAHATVVDDHVLFSVYGRVERTNEAVVGPCITVFSEDREGTEVRHYVLSPSSDTNVSVAYAAERPKREGEERAPRRASKAVSRRAVREEPEDDGAEEDDTVEDDATDDTSEVDLESWGEVGEDDAEAELDDTPPRKKNTAPPAPAKRQRAAPPPPVKNKPKTRPAAAPAKRTPQKRAPEPVRGRRRVF